MTEYRIEGVTKTGFKNITFIGAQPGAQPAASNFVFYDTETTGTNTGFDQIMQFGAIRTDQNFNELERFEIRCRLLPHIVPSPGAVRVTGISIEQLLDPTLPSHYEMMRAIKAKLTEWSPAIFIGHNSLGFDEHLLRQALYKTLHAPYLTNTNANCRTDSLRMIQAVARFTPNALTIPIDERGRQVFKLDRLAPANGFVHHAAHDAMGDVEATIHICKLMAERVPAHCVDGFENPCLDGVVVSLAADSRATETMVVAGRG